MTEDEALRLALEALEDYKYAEARTIIREALAQPEQEPVACVYKATTKKGEVAHFGEYSAAKAWAGWGSVEQVPLKTLTLIQKSIQPCPTCEALSRTVMLDQTSHDTTPPQRKPLTDEEILDCWKQAYEPGRREHDNAARMARAIEAAHGIKENT